MKKVDVSRALRDPEYRNSLSQAELAMLPDHPAGPSNIADEVLKSVAGGCGPTFEGCNCNMTDTTTLITCYLQNANGCC